MPGKCLTRLGSLSLAQLLQGPLKLLLSDLQLLVCLCLGCAGLLQLLLSDLQLLICLCLDSSRLLQLLLGHLQLLFGFQVHLLEFLQLDLQSLGLSKGGLAVLLGCRQLVACHSGLQPAIRTLVLPYKMLKALAPQDAHDISSGCHR